MLKAKLLAIPLMLGAVALLPDPAYANAWQQMIEKAPSDKGTRATGWYTTTTTCDNDPDTDYVFAFQMDARNPDGIRFKTTYWRVSAALPSSLNAYGNSFFEARVCVGDTTVSAAGGPEAVKANLWLYNAP